MNAAAEYLKNAFRSRVSLQAAVHIRSSFEVFK